MTNNNLECPVDLVLINERKGRLTAGGLFILVFIYLFANFWIIPLFLVFDFFVRAFNQGRHSPLNLISDKLIKVFAIKPKQIDQAPKRKNNALYSVCLILAGISTWQPAVAQPSKNESSFTIENYYKIKWGFADEFINLWKVNHYPLLKKAIETGDIISVTAEKPRLHSGEDTRWDFKVTIVFKNSEKAFDGNLTEPYKKLIYPDLEKLKKDEQHRFELLLSHWDVMIEKVAVE